MQVQEPRGGANEQVQILRNTGCRYPSNHPVFSSRNHRNYELVILNGRVMDPESGLDAIRNVGVKDGKISKITRAEIDGKETIDATGYVVAPGFIDLHIHGQDPYAIKLLLRDGVTSPLEIEFGAYPVEDYYREREGKWQANFGTSVGHGWARMNVMDGVNPKGVPVGNPIR